MLVICFHILENLIWERKSKTLKLTEIAFVADVILISSDSEIDGKLMFATRLATLLAKFTCVHPLFQEFQAKCLISFAESEWKPLSNVGKDCFKYELLYMYAYSVSCSLEHLVSILLDHVARNGPFRCFMATVFPIVN